MNSLDTYTTPFELIIWALTQFDDIDKLPAEMSDKEIKRVVHWLGLNAYDSYFVEGEPIMNRGGISLMLTVSLMVFPDYYQKYELSQFN
jgi:hypothetical protein